MNDKSIYAKVSEWRKENVLPTLSQKQYRAIVDKINQQAKDRRRFKPHNYYFKRSV